MKPNQLISTIASPSTNFLIILALKRNSIVFVLIIFLLCTGCGAIRSVQETRELLALELVMQYFEEPENRRFDVSYPFLLNEAETYQVTVYGLLTDGDYLIDTFAIDLEQTRVYFYLQEQDCFEEFITKPFFACVTSPNQQFRAESVGMYQDASSGLHALREMRVIDTETGEVLWSNESNLRNQFAWSSDSRYVAAQRSGRTWTETIVIDGATWVGYQLPTPYAISKLSQHVSSPDENLDYSSVRIGEWVSEYELIAEIEWLTAQSSTVAGSYRFVMDNLSVQDITLNEFFKG